MRWAGVRAHRRFRTASACGGPAEDHVGVRLLYSSQLLRLPPGILDETAVIISPVPGRPTGMALFRNENNTWMFTVVGMVGREPARRAR